jgi:hypothetical protein
MAEVAVVPTRVFGFTPMPEREIALLPDCGTPHRKRH